MWYDKVIIRILLYITKILARRSEKAFAHEIEELERFIFENEEEEN